MNQVTGPLVWMLSLVFTLTLWVCVIPLRRPLISVPNCVLIVSKEYYDIARVIQI